MLHLCYFAWLRERIGRGDEDLAPPPSVATVGELVAWLKARDRAYAAAFAEEKAIRAAVNQEFASPETRVAAGDEVAFFPPMTGG